MVFQRQLKQKGAGKRVLVCHFGKPHKHALSAGASGRHSPSTAVHWLKISGRDPTALSCRVGEGRCRTGQVAASSGCVQLTLSCIQGMAATQTQMHNKAGREN